MPDVSKLTDLGPAVVCKQALATRKAKRNEKPEAALLETFRAAAGPWY